MRIINKGDIMKKKHLLLAIIMLAVILGVAVSIIRNNFMLGKEVTFNGSRVVCPDSYYLDFEIMNKDEAESLTFYEGETMQVSWNIESGEVDIDISVDGEESIYQANNRGERDVESFELIIPKTGDYTIKLSAKDAKGWMKFLKVE